jgi:hypothetical protein
VFLHSKPSGHQVWDPVIRQCRNSVTQRLIEPGGPGRLAQELSAIACHTEDYSLARLGCKRAWRALRLV